MKRLICVILLINLCGCVHVVIRDSSNVTITIHDDDTPDIKTSIPASLL